MGSVYRPGDLLFAAISYCCCSVGMVVLNKWAMHCFGLLFSLLLFQNCMTMLLTVTWIKFDVFDVQPWQAQHLATFLLPSALYTLMMIASLKGMPLVAISTFIMFRNISILLTSLVEGSFLNRQFSRSAQAWLGIMFLSFVVHTLGDGNYNSTGYRWLVLYTVCYTSTVLLEKRAASCVRQSLPGCWCYICTLSLPWLLGALLLSVAVANVSNSFMAVLVGQTVFSTSLSWQSTVAFVVNVFATFQFGEVCNHRQHMQQNIYLDMVTEIEEEEAEVMNRYAYAASRQHKPVFR